MDDEAEELLARALALAPEQRRLIAYELLATLDDEVGYHEAWQAEVERRMTDDEDAWVPMEAAGEMLFGPRGPAAAPGAGAESSELDMLAAYRAALERLADEDLEFG
jgi:hypothetical protein